MADKIIMVDTTILINYFRTKDKSKTRLVFLSDHFNYFCIASITEFEIFTGAPEAQLQFWEEMLQRFIIYPFDSSAARLAALIQQELKAKRKSIDKADLFIAATAVANNLMLDSLNRKDFEHIDRLTLWSNSNE